MCPDTSSYLSEVSNYVLEAVRKTCGDDYVPIFESKCGTRIGSNWKSSGDFETCAAIDYFHRYKGKLCSEGEEFTTRKGNKLSFPVRIITTSDLGTIRDNTYTTPRELGESISQNFCEDSRKLLSSIYVKKDGRIILTTRPHFEWHSIMGRLYCPLCGLFCKGERGLRTHQVLVHQIEYESAQKTAYSSKYQIMAYSVNENIIDKWKNIVMQNDVVRNQLDIGINAAKNGDIDTIMQLVNLKIWDPETSVDRNGCTAFLWAAGEGHLNICQLLYTHFAIDVNCMKGKAGQKRHALHWATRNGHIEVCDWLVNVLGVDVNIATEDGTTPLHFACYTGQFSMCKWLVDCVNCNVNQLNSYGCNASQWCAINGDVDIMKLMKASGLDFSVINNNGHSALHKAAIKGNFECCKWLLLSDAEGGGGLQEVHMAEDSDGFTPMLFARSNGHIELANWFVSRTENIHFEHS